MKKKKTVLLIGLAMGLGIGLAIAVYLGISSYLSERWNKSLEKGVGRAEELCAAMKTRNSEMEAMVSATLTLEKYGPARKKEIKELEGLLAKLKQSERLILENELLLQDIFQREEKIIIQDFRQFGRRVKEVITIHMEVWRLIISPQIEKEEKGEILI